MFRPERIRPERQTIFGDTYGGVPNPMVSVERGYPTRNRGPIFTYVMPSNRYLRRPVARAPYAGLGMTLEDVCRSVGGQVVSGGCAISTAPLVAAVQNSETTQPCDDASGCPSGTVCCYLQAMGQGMPNICMEQEQCRQYSNALATQYCKQVNGVIRSELFHGAEWLGCQEVGDPTPPPEVPPALTVPAGGTSPTPGTTTTPTTSPPSSTGITIPRVALVAAAVIFAVALLS